MRAYTYIKEIVTGCNNFLFLRNINCLNYRAKKFSYNYMDFVKIVYNNQN